MEGGHPAVGAELLKRYGEGSEVVHAAAGHHDDIRPEHIYTVLVAAADAISAARPGARRETLENMFVVLKSWKVSHAASRAWITLSQFRPVVRFA